MDSSPHSASSLSDEFGITLPELEEDEVEGAEPHIHMPNPSYWPLLLGLAIALTMGSFLFVSYAPWIPFVLVIFVLITIIGWALEDPMAPVKRAYIRVQQAADPWKFKLGQNVIDAQGNWLGKVRARFSRYFLVERGSLIPKVYYVPQSAARDEVKNNRIFITLSEDELVHLGLNHVPDDLYEEAPDSGIPTVRGIPQFARRPLSPAETGHYNYGRMSPGINTDASGSYHREEVQPKPQSYVTEGIYTTDEPIPARVISPD